MLRMEWNALRIGDRVMVHNDEDLTAPLEEGTISIIVRSRPRGWNDLAIRLAGSSGAAVCPRGGACHLLSLRTEHCWRCEVLADAKLSAAA